MREPWLDEKVFISAPKKVSVDELVLGVLEPQVRYITPVKIWFVGGKLVFFVPYSGTLVNQRGKIFVRHVYEDIIYADVDCYKRYITVGMDGRFCFHDNLKEVIPEDAVIPVMDGAPFKHLGMILKKIEETERGNRFEGR